VLALTLASVALCKYKEMQASLLFLVESRSCTLALDQPRAKLKQGKERFAPPPPLLLYLLALLNAIITMTCVSRARSCIKLQELMQLDTCRAIKGNQFEKLSQFIKIN
jgi:hypothetical protein